MGSGRTDCGECKKYDDWNLENGFIGVEFSSCPKHVLGNNFRKVIVGKTRGLANIALGTRVTDRSRFCEVCSDACYAMLNDHAAHYCMRMTGNDLLCNFCESRPLQHVATVVADKISSKRSSSLIQVIKSRETSVEGIPPRVLEQVDFLLTHVHKSEVIPAIHWVLSNLYFYAIQLMDYTKEELPKFLGFSMEPVRWPGLSSKSVLQGIATVVTESCTLKHFKDSLYTAGKEITRTEPKKIEDDVLIVACSYKQSHRKGRANISDNSILELYQILHALAKHVGRVALWLDYFSNKRNSTEWLERGIEPYLMCPGAKLYSNDEETHESQRTWLALEKHNLEAGYGYYRKSIPGDNFCFDGSLTVIDEVTFVSGSRVSPKHAWSMNLGYVVGALQETDCFDETDKSKILDLFRRKSTETTPIMYSQPGTVREDLSVRTYSFKDPKFFDLAKFLQSASNETPYGVGTSIGTESFVTIWAVLTQKEISVFITSWNPSLQTVFSICPVDRLPKKLWDHLNEKGKITKLDSLEVAFDLMIRSKCTDAVSGRLKYHLLSELLDCVNSTIVEERKQ